MLRVPDASGRGRSSSPGDKHRHRSRSRKHSPSRERSKSSSRKPSSQQLYDSDSMDDYSRESRSRSTTRKRYDLDPSDDDRYKSGYKSDRGRRTPQDRYSLSDEDSIDPRHSNTSLRSERTGRTLYDSGSESHRRSASRALRPLTEPQYSHYSDVYTDSDDEGLAYGDLYYDYVVSGSERRSRSRERLRKTAKKLYDSDSSDGYTSQHVRESSARTKDPTLRYQTLDDPEPKLHRSHSKRDKYQSGVTSTLAAKIQAVKSGLTEKLGTMSSGLNEDEWPEIPECERPDFVPPNEWNRAYYMPASSQSPVPPAAPAPPTIPPTSSSSYAYAFSHPPPITKNEEEPPIRAPQYPTIPPPRYVPPEHYLNISKTTQSPQNVPNPPSQFVSPEHYLNMNKRAQSPQNLPTAPPQRSSGHQRAFSTGNVSTSSQQYAVPLQFQYAQPGPNIKYTSKSARPATPTVPIIPADRNQSGKGSNQPGPQYVEIKPGVAWPPGTRPHSLSVSAATEQTKMPGGFPEPSRPQASPLLEPYRGTYQSISPMPWPSTLSDMDTDFSELELDGGLSSSERAKNTKAKVKKTKSKETIERIERLHRQKISTEFMQFTDHGPSYDPKPDAKALKSALSHHKVDPKPLLAILPRLTAEEMLVLRAEYKNLVKMTGHGVNIAKHIALRVPGNFGKACHATALGKWESEAYWANFWYRSNSSRRELLIEALVGRPNAEIRRIKNCFKDKRYGDSLEKCMKAELKADKFRVAILLALEEKRQSDSGPINTELVRRDVQDLHRALISRDGGETALIQIIVGETLIHIINGALNRPIRDALLLHHAIAESGTGRDRAELLISRLVRMHWEPQHLERVKAEYKRRYGKYVEDHIVEEIINNNTNGKSDWAEFCIELVKSSSVRAMNGK
ncbi:hypothetical protein PRK78_002940 [Emydomyces testavorans]|uniref:Annexin ANXC4 n=1 Tax=Emydomyces testavorans TaxID=2070801 RepID=A0AAF0DFV4_9EURO|nr:hypothetical protein PRK78_002940 [Emydomyces testavorans]